VLTRKTVFGGLAAVVLAAGGTAGAVMLAKPADAAENTQVVMAGDDCHVEPSGNPWQIVCLSGPRRYKSQCEMMRTQKINQGYGPYSCTWATYSMATGWYFWYGSNRV
jgi:hypothetical protein